jgi:VWFA-related protein
MRRDAERKLCPTFQRIQAIGHTQIRMRSPTLAIVCALTLAAQDPTFRATTSLVRIDAEAIDSAGRVVPNLTQSDFRILDQNQPQPIVNFAFEEDPLDLILLFDTSSGMHDKLHSLIRATELGFHELRQGDRVCVMAYDSTSRLAQSFTPDLDAVNEAILLRVLATKFTGSPRIESAASDAAVRFRAEPASHRKRAIVAITDKAESDKAGASAAVQELWNANAVFSELIVGKGGQTRLLDAGPTSIADRTGGVAIAAGVPGEAFQESVHYVRSGYTMYYALPDGPIGSERALKVEFTPEAARRYPNVRVRARSGYVVRAAQ